MEYIVPPKSSSLDGELTRGVPPYELHYIQCVIFANPRNFDEYPSISDALHP